MPVSTQPYIYNAGRVAAGDDMTVANIVQGAQYGFAPSIPDMDVITPLVLRPVVPIVTHVPTMMTNYQPKSASILKNLVECHAKRIDGIDPSYTIEGASVPAGPDGQELFTPTNAKRAQLSPSMTFDEINGNLVWSFFRDWMRMIKDPDTQASSLAGVIEPGTTLQPHVMSFFSMDVLFIQYDITMQSQNIIDAYFVTSMWPNDIGAAGYKKEVGVSDHPERTIAFYGVLQHNRQTRAIGKKIAEVLQLHRYNADFEAPAATDVEAAIKSEGIANEIAQAMANDTPLGGNSAIA